MNFRQFLKMNEMHVKERGHNCFLLPVIIPRESKCVSEEERINRWYKVEEVYNVIMHMLNQCLHKQAKLQIEERNKNLVTFSLLDIDLKDENCIEQLIKNYLLKLTPNDFIETLNTNKNCPAYVFKIKNFLNVCNTDLANPSSIRPKNLYIKFAFIYKIDNLENKNTDYDQIDTDANINRYCGPTIHKRNNKNNPNIEKERYIKIEDNQIILHEISFHLSK